MKRHRHNIARTSNEIYGRTQKRKATAKEKELLNELKKLMGEIELEWDRVGLTSLGTKILNFRN